MATSSESPSPGIRITPRTIQVILGIAWLLDGALQSQPFMFSSGFLTQIVLPAAAGQPAVVGQPILVVAGLVKPYLPLANAGFATIQVLIGLGLLVGRWAVKPALAVSFAWTLVVWWFGEGLGMLAMGMASPLTGAPGPVLLYALVGFMVWPVARADERSAAGGGLLGDVGGRIAWGLLWLLLAGLMLQPVNRGESVIALELLAAAHTAPSPLARLDTLLAQSATDQGLWPASLLAAVMVAIAVGVLLDWHRNLFLLAGALLALLFWITTQSLGGIFTGTATDPNAGPLIALLALTLYARVPKPGLTAALGRA
jgi:hypothetical protein